MAEQWKKLPAAEKQKYVEKAKQMSEAQSAAVEAQPSTPSSSQDEVMMLDLTHEQPQQALSISQGYSVPNTVSFFPAVSVQYQTQDMSFNTQQAFNDYFSTSSDSNSTDFFS